MRAAAVPPAARARSIGSAFASSSANSIAPVRMSSSSVSSATISTIACARSRPRVRRLASAARGVRARRRLRASARVALPGMLSSGWHATESAAENSAIDVSVRSRCRYHTGIDINVVSGGILAQTQAPAESCRAGDCRSATGALPAQVRILGLDPGSQRTGYAVVETQAGRIAYIVSGAIRTAATRWPSACRRFSPASSR